MATILDKSLKRELMIGADPYMLTISPEGLKLVPKGKRNGIELQWPDLVSGQAALAVALNASLEKLGPATRTTPSKRFQTASAVPAPPMTGTSASAAVASISKKAGGNAPDRPPTKSTVVKRGRAR